MELLPQPRISLFWLSSVPMYVYTTFSSFISWWTCKLIPYLDNLWIVLQWTWCADVFQHTRFISFGYIPGSGITGTYNSTFNFLRNHHSVFHNGSANLDFYQECVGVLFSHISGQHLLIFCLFLFVCGLGIKTRASHMLGKCDATWVMP
jgi:hypothetical protein